MGDEVLIVKFKHVLVKISLVTKYKKGSPDDDDDVADDEAGVTTTVVADFKELIEVGIVPLED